MLQIEKPPKKCPSCQSELASIVVDRDDGHTRRCLECGLTWEAVDTKAEREGLICPICRSTDAVEMLNHAGEPSGNCLCRSCGCQFSLRSDDQMSEVRGLVVVCPHCATLDSIQELGGEEWCEECNLDPNAVNLPSPNIGHLYKGAARRLLLRGAEIVGEDRIYGQFLRRECGPHCTYGDACAQTIGNIRICAEEEEIDFDEDFEHQESGAMSKRRRGKKGRKHQGRRQGGQKHRGTGKVEPAKVSFFCAKGGLLEKMYGTENSNTEQSGSTESQP